MPVMCLDSSPARNRMALATSSGSAIRPCGMVDTTCFSNATGSGCPSIQVRTSCVRVRPGATALTRTPCRAHSIAAVLVSASSAPLAAAYRLIVGTPTDAVRDVTLTIDPRPRASIFAPAACCISRQPRKLVSSTRRTSSSEVSSTELVQSMAALLTSTSAPPHSSAAPTAACAVRLSATSPATNLVLPSLCPPAWRATTTTRAPCSTKSRTVASPMPAVPPVTMATLPARRPLTLLRAPARQGTRTRCWPRDRKSTRLNSSHSQISYAVFCLKKKKKLTTQESTQPPLPQASERSNDRDIRNNSANQAVSTQFTITLQIAHRLSSPTPHTCRSE